MERRESSFQGTLDHDVTPNLQGGYRGSQVGFVLKIRKFLEDDNGNVVEDEAEGFQEETFFPEFEFGSYRHRNYIARRLREAGCRDERGFGRMFDEFFSNAELELESEKENKSESESHVGRIPRFTLCVKKFERREDDLEARAV
ncbi:hypothetical protein CRYUN_Cryun09bG0142400 [Craigia yunnanensis]